MSKHRIAIFLSIMAIMMVLLSACGSKSSKLNVEMSDFKFIPDTFTVPAGANVSLTLKNSGALEHSFVIMKSGTTASVPFSQADQANIYFQVKVEAGQSTTTSFTAPSAPGNYEVVCNIAGHLEQGMKATLTVTQ
jgi:uncharacterized cupredoxin-like copper-binding protein